MNEDISENIVSFLQKALPLISSAMILFLAYIPVSMPILNNVRPDLGLICIYFWILHRPDLFNLVSIVLLGLWDMTISSALPGSGLFAYLTLYVLLYNTQRFFNAKPFVVIWYGFMALSLAVLLIKWLVVSIYYGQFLPLSMLMFGYLIGAALYPLVSAVLAFIQNKLIQDEGL